MLFKIDDKTFDSFIEDVSIISTLRIEEEMSKSINVFVSRLGVFIHEK